MRIYGFWILKIWNFGILDLALNNGNFLASNESLGF
jgi:hypothetical protein